ncbi:MAG: hypothetical protein EAZ42_03975 [Verrucomicrobia bacterium]|nr:MAG: hypothetical protein EAZ42_03975 [Verrucomicrobiota bacterium]
MKLLSLFLIATPLPATATELGKVSGRIPIPTGYGARIAVEKYTGTISGRVAPNPPPRAAIWIEGPGLHAPPTPLGVTLDQKNYQFAQSMLVIPRGTVVEFPNEDPDYHNIFSLSRTERFDLGRFKKDENPAPSVRFDTAGLVRLQCEIHEHMRAIIRVVDSPHFTTTDETGHFLLTQLPPGKWLLHAQLDEKHQWTLPITITAGQTLTADFQKP